MCKDLIDEGAILNIHDLKVTENLIKLIFRDYLKTFILNESRKKISYLEDVFENCAAALLVNEWKEYSKIDLEEVEKK